MGALKIIGIASAAIVGWYVVDVKILGNEPPPPPVNNSRDCDVLGNIAGLAWEARHRGISESSTLRHATSQVTNPNVLPRVRGAVRIGYSDTRAMGLVANSFDGARETAVTRCRGGAL